MIENLKMKQITKTSIHPAAALLSLAVLLLSVSCSDRNNILHPPPDVNDALERLDEDEIPVLLKTLKGLSDFFRGYQELEKKI